MIIAFPAKNPRRERLPRDGDPFHFRGCGQDRHMV